MKTIESFPLHWPDGTPRSLRQIRSKFNTKDLAKHRDQLINELKLMGARDIIISTNLSVRKDGLPYSGQAQPRDRGVAIYFKWQGAPRALACDKWDRVEDNVHVLELSIAAMRGLERWGATDILQKAFQGFTALPSPATQWWEVLQCRRESSVELVELQYKNLARLNHPDLGGSHEQMQKVNRAMEEFKKERNL